MNGTDNIDCNIDQLKKWLPPSPPFLKKLMSHILNDKEPSIGTFVLRKYIQFIKSYLPTICDTHDQNVAAKNISSGLGFFCGSMVYILHFENSFEHIEDICLYNILYILVDNYIDDAQLDRVERKKGIQLMYSLLEDPFQNLESHHSFFNIIAKVYRQMITRCPQVKNKMYKLFQTEIDGLKIQDNGDLTRDEYYNIAIKKGIYTIDVLRKITGSTCKKIKEASRNLGVITQLLDDSLDVFDDQRNGIHTIATYEKKNHATLDALWMDIAKRINDIPPNFNVFKLIYGAFAVYLPDRQSEIYSKNIRNMTTSHNLFDYKCGCDAENLLITTIIDELNIEDASS